MYKLTPLPPTNVKITHKICHELLIRINISLYSPWNLTLQAIHCALCMLQYVVCRPGANVDTYKQTDRAVTSSYTPILHRPRSSQWTPWKLIFSLFTSHPPLQSPTINISPFFAKKIITIQENYYLHFWILITVHFISMDFCKICILNLQNPFLLNFCKPCVYNNIYSSTISFSIFPFKRA